MTSKTSYEEEQENLIVIIDEINQQISKIPPKYHGGDYTEQIIDSARDEMRKRLNSLSMEPYFGRIDFQDYGKGVVQAWYIGKYGLEIEASGQQAILDWRAPAASLFYSFNGGDQLTTYNAPMGDVSGYICLKRNLAIRERILKRVTDSYVRGGENNGTTDEFLLYKLGENKDNRLRDIVSTIQAEQNRIIRAPKNNSLIIQGVAGSGKTTVALHRLAYLIYQYKDQVKADRMIIFAPNMLFLDYISNVLPELGVGDIQQNTFTAWATDLLELEGFRLKSEGKQSSHWFSLSRKTQDHDRTPGRYKGSTGFKDWIERCISALEKNTVPQIDFQPWEGANSLTFLAISDWFDKEYRHYPLAKRKERVIARIKRWIEMELNVFSVEKDQKERRKIARQRLATYLRKWPNITPFALYKSFFGLPVYPSYMDYGLREEVPTTIVNWTRRQLCKRLIDPEDLTPLLYIRWLIFGANGVSFDHIVIDEAQDFSPFQIMMLKKLMREPSFTILGDLMQAIHEYKGIHHWDEFRALFDDEEINYFELLQSYRSTTQIIEFSNNVIKHFPKNIPHAIPVFRGGEHVVLDRLDDNAELFDYTRKFIEKQLQDMSTVAILTRTPEDCTELFGVLKENGVEVSLIEETGSEYRGGVSILPVYLSKGFEFDSVLILGVDNIRYPYSPMHAKLLYVACTRALHRLTLVYTGEQSLLLN